MRKKRLWTCFPNGSFTIRPPLLHLLYSITGGRTFISIFGAMNTIKLMPRSNGRPVPRRYSLLSKRVIYPGSMTSALLNKNPYQISYVSPLLPLWESFKMSLVTTEAIGNGDVLTTRILDMWDKFRVLAATFLSEAGQSQ